MEQHCTPATFASLRRPRRRQRQQRGVACGRQHATCGQPKKLASYAARQLRCPRTLMCRVTPCARAA